MSRNNSLQRLGVALKYVDAETIYDSLGGASEREAFRQRLAQLRDQLKAVANEADALIVADECWKLLEELPEMSVRMS